MDLSTLDVKKASEDGAELILRNPFTGDAIPGVVLRVIGRDSDKLQNARKEAERKRAEGRLDAETANRHCIAAAIVGWENVELDGKPLEYSPENAIRLVTDERTSWVAEQVAPFSLSRRNFTPKSVGGSDNTQDT